MGGGPHAWYIIAVGRARAGLVGHADVLSHGCGAEVGEQCEVLLGCEAAQV